MLERVSKPELLPPVTGNASGFIARHARGLLALVIVIAAAIYLLGNGTVSLWDRDEPRYAQCSRQMLLGFPGPGGHAPGWVVPRFLDDLRTEKPPLIYWCQAASMKLFGDNAFAARFPSAVAMTLVLALLAVTLYRVMGPERAVWAVFIFASAGLTIMSAKMCLTDATLLLWILTAQICLFVIYRGNRSWGVTIALWSAIGLGGLTKGPIVLVVLLVAMAALAILDWLQSRSTSLTPPASLSVVEDEGTIARVSVKPVFHWWLAARPVPGILILTAIVTPWLLLVHHQAPDFLPRLFKAAERHLKTGEKHNGPPGFYLGLVWGLWFPWSLLLPTTMVHAWRNRRDPLVRYCLATVLGVWVFQEIMTTKLPFYLLPAFPALAVLTADAITRCLRKEADDFSRPAFRWAAGIWAAAVVGVGAAPWLLALPSLGLMALLPRPVMVLLSIVAVAYASAVFALFVRQRHTAGLVTMGIGMIAVFAILFTAYLPQADFLHTSRRVARVLADQRVGRAEPVMMIQYKEPSLAFYRNGSMIEQPMDHYLDRTPSAEWPDWIVMPRGLFESGTSTANKLLLEVVTPEPIRGANYAGKIDGSQLVELIVLHKKRSP